MSSAIHFIFTATILAVPEFMWAIGTKDAFTTIQAERAEVNNGVISVQGYSSTPVMGFIDPGDYLGYKNVEFSKEPIAIKMFIASDALSTTHPKIHVRLDSTTADPIATVHVEQTLWNRFVTAIAFIPIDLRSVDVHDVYFTFQNDINSGWVVNIDYFTFISAEDAYSTNCASYNAKAALNDATLILKDMKTILLNIKQMCPKLVSTGQDRLRYVNASNVW